MVDVTRSNKFAKRSEGRGLPFSVIDQERNWGGELEGVKEIPVVEGPKLIWGGGLKIIIIIRSTCHLYVYNYSIP